MQKLSKFDVLFYLSQTDSDFKELVKYLKNNIFFEKTKERTIKKCVYELKKMGLIEADLKIYHEKADDLLAFLFWCRMKDKDYNILLHEKTENIFKIIFENSPLNIEKLIKLSGLSRPTIFKIIDILEKNKFISRTKSKPLTLEANLNDLTFFYINFFCFSFKNFEKRFAIPKIKKHYSKKMENELIKIHIHSTTVTEGNTATKEDVEKVVNDFPVNLTPRETTEILNTKKAIEYLYSIRKKEINLDEIKNLHRFLMGNLLDNAGQVYYGTKKIAGFRVKDLNKRKNITSLSLYSQALEKTNIIDLDYKTKLPHSKEEIDFSLNSLLNFYKKNKNMRTEILSSIIHFIFVSIHPFADGNGRTARLLHSWILLKKELPIFAFNPDKRLKYFEFLEEGRNSNINKFIEFCISEWAECLKKLK